MSSGHKLRDTGTVYWEYPNDSATNISGFTARAAGRRNGGYSGAVFYQIRQDCWIWTSTFDVNYKYLKISGGASTAMVGGDIKENSAYSVRLVKDSTTLSHGESGTYVGNDGTVYKTICIGTQEWLAENLIETKYRDQTAIPEVSDGTSWYNLSSGAWCSYDNNREYSYTTQTSYTKAEQTKLSAIAQEHWINFDYDITAGVSQTFVLDISTTVVMTAEVLKLEVDDGTLSGIQIKKNTTPISGLDNATAASSIQSDAADGTNNLIDQAWRITLVTSTTYTGNPTRLYGKLELKRR